MKYPLLACLLCLAAPLVAEDIREPELLKVMLQGDSAPDLRQLVEQQGGHVSHELHIINAVGATLTREQLDVVLQSPLISRYIDDLSISEDPAEPEDDPGCDVGAALEISLSGRELAWHWFNKHSSPARVGELDIQWPADRGQLAALRLDGVAVPASLLAGQNPGALHLKFEPDNAPSLATNGDLRLVFSEVVEELAQHDFEIRARFEGDCKADLIPGYPVNGPDSYYPTAAGADLLHQNGVTGSGITVAVLDSGLWEHPALALDTRGRPRVVGRFDAILNLEGKEVFDESGHGTHMTSVLAHSEPVLRDGRPSGSYKGIAPDVGILAVKAFNKEGQGDFLDIVRGIQYVVDTKERLNTRVLNLSFAARPRWPYWDDPINQALMRAWHSGITVVAAAGNEGPDPMTIGSPGNLPYIITVGAVTDSWTVDTRDDDYIPDFSSRGPTPSAHIKPDIVAPGGHIAGITRPGSTLTQEHPEYMLSTGEFVMTGTSQASALVSGIVALLLQLEPELAPDDVKCKLISSAELAINRDGLLAYSPFEQGNGYVSAARAVTLGDRGCANEDMDIEQDMSGKDHYQGPAVVDDEGNVSLPGLAEMVAPEESAKGRSETRRWGVKEHIERPDLPPREARENPAPFDWEGAYLREKARIEALSVPGPDNAK